MPPSCSLFKVHTVDSTAGAAALSCAHRRCRRCDGCACWLPAGAPYEALLFGTLCRLISGRQLTSKSLTTSTRIDDYERGCTQCHTRDIERLSNLHTIEMNDGNTVGIYVCDG